MVESRDESAGLCASRWALQLFIFCCVHLGHSYIDMTRLSYFFAVCPAGLIGACGISVLCSLMRVHLFLEEHRWGICFVFCFFLPDLALEIEYHNCMDSQSILKRSTHFRHILKTHLFSVFPFWPPPPAAAIKMKKTHWIRRHKVIKGKIQMDSTGWFSFSLWLWFWQ